MSTNIIYCYSGSGNCLYMAKNIAKKLGDTDIVMMRTFPEITDATEYKRVGFVFPCYGGGLPGDVEKYVRAIKVSPTAYKFGVVQYAGYAGNGLAIIDSIIGLDYWTGLSQHCSAIWLMPHWLCMPPLPIKLEQKRSEITAKRVARAAKKGIHSRRRPMSLGFFKIESASFSKLNVKINNKFKVSNACVGCGTCETVCPRENIKVVDGKAVIGKNCIGCMSCVQYCPSKAINVGKLTLKRERYHNPKVKAADLAEKVIHVR